MIVVDSVAPVERRARSNKKRLPCISPGFHFGTQCERQRSAELFNIAERLLNSLRSAVTSEAPGQR